MIHANDEALLRIASGTVEERRRKADRRALARSTGTTRSGLAPARLFRRLVASVRAFGQAGAPHRQRPCEGCA